MGNPIAHGIKIGDDFAEWFEGGVEVVDVLVSGNLGIGDQPFGECSRRRSSFRILDAGRREHVVTEISAKFFRRAQINLATAEQAGKFPLHAR